MKKKVLLRWIVCLAGIIALECTGLFMLSGVQPASAGSESGSDEVHPIAGDNVGFGYRTMGASFDLISKNLAASLGYGSDREVATVWFTGDDWGGSAGAGTQMPKSIGYILRDCLTEKAITLARNGNGEALTSLRKEMGSNDGITFEFNWYTATFYEYGYGTSDYTVPKLQYSAPGGALIKRENEYDLSDLSGLTMSASVINTKYASVYTVPATINGKETFALPSMKQWVVPAEEVTLFLSHDRQTFLDTIKYASVLFNQKNNAVPGWPEGTVYEWGEGSATDNWAKQRYGKTAFVRWPSYEVSVVYTNCAECAKNRVLEGTYCPHCHQTFWMEGLSGENAQIITVSARDINDGPVDSRYLAPTSNWIWEDQDEIFDAAEDTYAHDGLTYNIDISSFSWTGNRDAVPAIRLNGKGNGRYMLGNIKGDTTIYLTYKTNTVDVTVNYVDNDSKAVVATKTVAVPAGRTSGYEKDAFDLSLPSSIAGTYQTPAWNEWGKFVTVSPSGTLSQKTPGGTYFYFNTKLTSGVTVTVSVTKKPVNITPKVSFEYNGTVVLTMATRPGTVSNAGTFTAGNILSSTSGNMDAVDALAGITTSAAPYGYVMSGTYTYNLTYDDASKNRSGAGSLMSPGDIAPDGASGLTLRVPVTPLAAPVSVTLVGYCGDTWVGNYPLGEYSKGSSPGIPGGITSMLGTQAFSGYHDAGKAVHAVYTDRVLPAVMAYGSVDPADKRWDITVTRTGLASYTVAHDGTEAACLFIYVEVERYENVPLHIKFITSESQPAVSIARDVTTVVKGTGYRLRDAVQGYLASDPKLQGSTMLGACTVVYGNGSAVDKQLKTVRNSKTVCGIPEGGICDLAEVPEVFLPAYGSDVCSAVTVFVKVSQEAVPVTVKYIPSESGKAICIHRQAAYCTFQQNFDIGAVVSEDLAHTPELNGYRVSSCASNVVYVYGWSGAPLDSLGTADHTLATDRSRYESGATGCCTVTLIEDSMYTLTSGYCVPAKGDTAGYTDSARTQRYAADHLTVFVRVEPLPEQTVPVSVKYITSEGGNALYKRQDVIAAHKPGTLLDLTGIISSDMASVTALKKYEAQRMVIVYGAYGSNTTQGIYAHRLDTLMKGTQGSCCSTVAYDAWDITPFTTRASGDGGSGEYYDHICVFVYVTEPLPDRLDVQVRYVTGTSASDNVLYTHPGTLTVMPGQTLGLGSTISTDLAAMNSASGGTKVYSRFSTDTVYAAYGSSVHGTSLYTLINTPSSRTGGITTLTGDTSSLFLTAEDRGVKQLSVYVICRSQAVVSTKDYYSGRIFYMNADGTKCLKVEAMNRLGGTAGSTKIYPGMNFTHPLEKSITAAGSTSTWTPMYTECYVSSTAVQQSDAATRYALMHDTWFGQDPSYYRWGYLYPGETFDTDGMAWGWVDDVSPYAFTYDYSPRGCPYLSVFVFCEEHEYPSVLKVVYIDGEGSASEPDVLYTETFEDAFTKADTDASVVLAGGDWYGIRLELSDRYVRRYLNIDGVTWWNTLDLQTVEEYTCTGGDTVTFIRDYPWSGARQEVYRNCIACGQVTYYGVTYTDGTPPYADTLTHGTQTRTVTSYNATALKPAWKFVTSTDAAVNGGVLSASYQSCTKQDRTIAGSIGYGRMTGTTTVMYHPLTGGTAYIWASGSTPADSEPTSMILYIPVHRIETDHTDPNLPTPVKAYINAYDTATGQTVYTTAVDLPTPFVYEFGMPEVIENLVSGVTEAYAPTTGEALAIYGSGSCTNTLTLSIDTSHAEVCPTCGGKGYINNAANNALAQEHYNRTGHYPVINVSYHIPYTTSTYSTGSTWITDDYTGESYCVGGRATRYYEQAEFFCSVCGERCGYYSYDRLKIGSYSETQPTVNQGMYTMCPTCSVSGRAGSCTVPTALVGPNLYSAITFSGYKTWPVFKTVCKDCGGTPVTSLNVVGCGTSVANLKNWSASLPFSALTGGTSGTAGFVLPGEQTQYCGKPTMPLLTFRTAKASSYAHTEVFLTARVERDAWISRRTITLRE